jgi:hypothetical protein
MIRMFESSTAWPEEEGRALTDFRPPEPPDISVDFDGGRVVVEDRGEVVTYVLSMGYGRGRAARCGWTEILRDRDGQPVETGVTTAEVMAVLRDVGREQDAVRMTLATAAFFEQAEDCWQARKIADRLRSEVRDGHNLRRVSLRPLQALVLERLVAGESLSDMCERGGFVGRRGKLDTSWFQRRAGLLPDRCSKTGKLRFARTANYAVFCRLVRAAGAEPHELGV